MPSFNRAPNTNRESGHDPFRRTRRRAGLIPFLLSLAIVPGAWAQALDSDADGIEDTQDNCFMLPNPDQRDADSDGLGNDCDGDFDNDGIVSTSDFTSHFLPSYRAAGDDGTGTDMNGDGHITTADFTLFLAQYQRGTPGPGAAPSPEQAQEGAVMQGWLTGVNFVDRAVTFEDVDGVAIFEGDIILGRTADLIIPPEGGNDASGSGDGVGSNTSYSIVLSGAKHRWPDGILPFRISPNLNSTMRARIQAAMDHWEANTPIEFVRVTSMNLDDFDSMVEFLSVNQGCSAEVGRQGGWQPINLSNACSVGSVIHEIGHAVGLWHEQSREDRDDFVEIRWENIEAGPDDDCEVYDDDEDKCHNFEQHITDGDDVGPYDYASIMHYGRRAFSKNGMDTIVPRDPTAVIGQRTGLSDGDIDAVRALLGAREWKVSHGGSTRYSTINGTHDDVDTLRFADFDGDGETDVFTVIDGTWLVSWSGETRYEAINTASEPLEALRFGDFDGDGEADVFSRFNPGNGGTIEWRVSYSGTSRWQTVNSAGTPISELRFADIDGDGRTDVFNRYNPGGGGTIVWRVSYGATGRWQTINSAGTPLSELRFADLDGDGRDDVFNAYPAASGGGTIWRVSYGGTGRWQVINSSSESIDQLRFGDFDGDGRADVFTRSASGAWLVSDGGTNGYREINTASESLDQLRFGDFDGDGATDVFAVTEPLVL